MRGASTGRRTGHNRHKAGGINKTRTLERKQQQERTAKSDAGGKRDPQQGLAAGSVVVPEDHRPSAHAGLAQARQEGASDLLQEPPQHVTTPSQCSRRANATAKGETAGDPLTTNGTLRHPSFGILYIHDVVHHWRAVMNLQSPQSYPTFSGILF